MDPEEEAEDSLEQQQLEEVSVQLVQGEQQWPDGCFYRGQFGLNMKLGYGEFSWPTGEVTALPLPWEEQSQACLLPGGQSTGSTEQEE